MTTGKQREGLGDWLQEEEGKRRVLMSAELYCYRFLEMTSATNEEKRESKKGQRSGRSGVVERAELEGRGEQESGKVEPGI